MKIIYFPFTYVSNASYRLLSSFFRKITVFQSDPKQLPPAMAFLVSSGFLDRAIPIPGYEARLQERIASFKKWGQTMDDKDRAAFRAVHAEAEQVMESSTWGLRTDIRRSQFSEKPQAKNRPESKRITEEERILWAYMMLELAMEWDMKTEEIATDFSHYQAMEKRLFDCVRDSFSEDLSDLRPLPTGGAQGIAEKEKIKERMLAWSTLLPFYQEETGVFITDNQEVLDHLREFNGLGERTFRLESHFAAPEKMDEGAAIHEALETGLVKLSRGQAHTLETLTHSSEQRTLHSFYTVFLDLYVAKNISPCLFFKSETSCPAVSMSGVSSPAFKTTNTVICFIGENE